MSLLLFFFCCSNRSPSRLNESFHFLQVGWCLFDYEFIENQSLTFQKNCFYLLQWKLFKNDEKYLLFNVKSCFRSWDIFALSWLFAYVEKRLDKKAYRKTGTQDPMSTQNPRRTQHLWEPRTLGPPRTQRGSRTLWGPTTLRGPKTRIIPPIKYSVWLQYSKTLYFI